MLSNVSSESVAKCQPATPEVTFISILAPKRSIQRPFVKRVFNRRGNRDRVGVRWHVVVSDTIAIEVVVIRAIRTLDVREGEEDNQIM